MNGSNRTHDWPRVVSISLLATCLVLAGCDDTGSGDGDMSGADATSDATTSDALVGDATGPDATTSDDASDADDVTGIDGSDASDASEDLADTMAPACTTAPTARYGPALTPGSCGLQYEWTDPATLGNVLEVGPVSTFPKALLEGLFMAEGLDVGQPLQYDVGVRVVRYQTQDRGQLLDATTFVAYPTNRFETEPAPMINVLHGTAGFNDSCAPSTDTQEAALAIIFASLGYVALQPDYIGLKSLGEPTGFVHPYLIGEPTAVASLDAARAVMRMQPDEIGGACVAPQMAVIGGSQGGHAALWVDRLHPYYAPEIELAGTVATVPPADLLGQSQRALESNVNATANTIGALLTGAPYYGWEERLDEVFLGTIGAEALDLLATECDYDVEGSPFENIMTLEDVFQPSFLQVAQNDGVAALDPWGCLMTENGLTTTSVPRINEDPDSYGILFITGEADDLVHTPIERNAFETLCAAGMPMEYLECAGAGHGPATLWAAPELVRFIGARLAGESAANSCVRGAPVTCEGTPTP